MIGVEDAVRAGTLSAVDLRLAAEELAVLCRGRAPALARLLPELAGVEPLDVVERTLVARGLLELGGDGTTQLVAFAGDLVLALCEPAAIEHVTVDELGAGPGFWVAIAHGDEVAVTITPTEIEAVYDVSVSGPYAPAPGAEGEAELQTTLGRLEQLLTARREGTLTPGAGDRAAQLVGAASSYVERVRRTFQGRVLGIEHRVLLDVAGQGTYLLAGLPSPVEGDEVDAAATIAWIRSADGVEDPR